MAQDKGCFPGEVRQIAPPFWHDMKGRTNDHDRKRPKEIHDGSRDNEP